MLGLRYRVKWLLRTRSLDGCVAELTPPRVPTAPAIEGELERIHRVTDALLRRFRPTRTACMVRALVRYRLLRQHGVDAIFSMGVRRDEEGELTGHAWVTVDGEAVMEREDWRAYRSQFRYPPPDKDQP